MSKNNEDFFCEKKRWSIIKDDLLASYLSPYFSKILATRQPVFYVDGFAGKGMFDDGKPGSPVIALDIIDEALSRTNFKPAIIQPCFIELKHAEDLRNNIAKYKDAKVIKGKYEDNIEQQLLGKQSQNVFLYIDPYGFKSLHFSIFEELSNKNFYSIETLINLNSFGFMREACRAMNVNFDLVDFEDIIEIDNAVNSSKQKSIDDLTKVAGGEYWTEIIERYKRKIIDGYEAEKLFVNKYCDKLSEHFEYVLNMPIRLERKQRPKYRMIHATNHPKGCTLMNDNMCKRWEILQELQNQGKISLFPEDVENNLISKDEMRKEIWEVLSKHTGYIDIDVFCAEFVSKYGVRFSTGDIREEFKHLYNVNKVAVKREPEFTKTGKPTKFWTTDNGQKVEVRCL